MSEANPFSNGAENYARHRPGYPPELAQALASHCKSHEFAIELGCGTGQFSHQLAEHYEKVLATDLSADQINHASLHPKIKYSCEPAEDISADDNSADLIVAAQAAHWFDLERFYKEASRVAKDKSIIALLSYGILNVEGDVDERFQKFYWEDIHQFWASDRVHVETGYKDFGFPFKEFQLTPVEIVCQWNLSQFIGYIETWSAISSAKAQGAAHHLEQFKKDMQAIWGAPGTTKKIIWPISGRIGEVVK